MAIWTKYNAADTEICLDKYFLKLEQIQNTMVKGPEKGNLAADTASNISVIHYIEFNHVSLGCAAYHQEFTILHTMLNNLNDFNNLNNLNNIINLNNINNLNLNLPSFLYTNDIFYNSNFK